MSITDSPHITADEPEAGIYVIRITRLDRKNALNLAMYQALSAHLHKAAQTDSVRVIVLTGSEDCFTSGNDLSDFAQGVDFADVSGAILQFMQTLLACPKPVVAAVNGMAIGIGTTLLLHCDLVYAEPNCTFSVPFVRLGLCPEFASSLLLPRLAGMAKASEWLLTGKNFSAAEAHNAGLLNDVVADPFAAAMAEARSLSSLPPSAVRRCKALLRAPLQADLDAALSRENKAFGEALDGPEFEEAVEAFFAKRAPDFSQF